ncbi:hypothetical protein CTAYLR_010421 [Chrysophaeum taylorii]|uniref:Dynein axonemal assembly factor 11-like CS domain-containing protein n=1 Tax=Chrysophaeum taylorii TaxID=2483200 RepID=A0AAD7UI62_9STRA|nr:hypothetical protein CTAYLR_010421 [Chrysophaeum taylorii]
MAAAAAKGNRITRELIRKRAEHNESIVSTLEELTLHQEELVAIDPVLGSSCRKLKILYLQNNIISKLENLHHLKDLEYLNVALNNISKIEGLERCEFLKRLDATVNFIDVDELEESVAHLAKRLHLRELYMMGNPAQLNWPGFQNYVVARVPQLALLDGVEVTRSMRIIAERQLPHLRLELRELAAQKRAEKAAKPPVEEEKPFDPEEATPYTPEVRTAMYEEIAEQKKEEEARKAHMLPRERNAAREQQVAVAETRAAEESGEIRQCNQGKWEFHFDEATKPGCLLLDVAIARHLDSSLIDLDVHPRYVSVVIKSKTLRLKLPFEVQADDAKAQRSKTTGHLLVIMPKLDKDAPPLFTKKFTDAPKPTDATLAAKKSSSAASSRVTRRAAPASIGSMLLADAKRPPTEADSMTAVRTTRRDDLAPS